MSLLPNGEVVSKCGTRLGVNKPDAHGNRFLLSLACISGNPGSATAKQHLRAAQQ